MRRAVEQIGEAYGEFTPAYEDATWVGMRLAEILPLAPVERQELLELSDGPERLQWLQSRLDIQESRDDDSDRSRSNRNAPDA